MHRGTPDPIGTSLLEVARAEAVTLRRSIFLAANLAGICNMLILASFNAVAYTPSLRDVSTLITIGTLVALYILSARYTDNRIADIIESVLTRRKVQLGKTLAHAELETLEQVKTAEICDRITDNFGLISDRGRLIAAMIPAALVMFYATTYLTWLMPAAGAVAILLGFVGSTQFVLMRTDYVAQARTLSIWRIAFLERLNDLLDGFKEIQFSRRKHRDVQEHIAQSSNALREQGAKTNNLTSDSIAIGNLIMFLLLGSIGFALRVYTTLSWEMLAKLIAVATFLRAPFMRFTVGLSAYLRADVAWREVVELERKLESGKQEPHIRFAAQDPWPAGPISIEADAIEYTYTTNNDDNVFHVGPLHLRIEGGETLFIVGGNGSGKSTLLKVLTGLYTPAAGTLRMNGIAIDHNNMAAYREHITAIFSDFHLFAKLYGLKNVEDDEVNRLLSQMHLEGQTSFAHRTFTKLKLSTGQKKRMAMIVALLEKRPLCVFDEWAADQDPQFRAYFYNDLLPRLRQEGRTVIVVSHDDRYFHRADRIVTMADGTIRSIERPQALQAAS